MRHVDSSTDRLKWRLALQGKGLGVEAAQCHRQIVLTPPRIGRHVELQEIAARAEAESALRLKLACQVPITVKFHVQTVGRVAVTQAASQEVRLAAAQEPLLEPAVLSLSGPVVFAVEILREDRPQDGNALPLTRGSVLLPLRGLRRGWLWLILNPNVVEERVLVLPVVRVNLKLHRNHPARERR